MLNTSLRSITRLGWYSWLCR